MTAYYWATTPTQDIGAKVAERAKRYQDNTQTNGRRALWVRAARSLFGLDPQGSQRNSQAIVFAGSEGERVDLRANIYRAIVRQQVVMTVGSRPAFRCRARAYDASTDEARLIGDAIIDNALNDKLEQMTHTAVWHALTLGEGWISCVWDPMARGGQGDYKARVHRPDQVIRDNTCTDDEYDWVILISSQSRWTLAAMYPEHAQTIVNAQSMDTLDMWTQFRSGSSSQESVDYVLTYEFFHKPTPSLPQGRATLVVGDVAIADGINPYGRVPAYVMRSTREPGSAFGYADSWDLMALQQMVDSIYTMVATTKENFGLRTIFSPEGSGYDVELIGTMRVLSGTQAPVPVDLEGNAVQSGIAAAEAFVGAMDRMSGLNDAVTGNAGANAAAAQVALLQQQAAQLNSQNQLAYVRMFTDVVRAILDLYKEFATEERVIHIAGNLRAPLVKRWSKETLQVLDGIDIEMGSSAMRTVAFRHQILKELLDAGAITDPEKYIAAIENGRLETVTDAARAAEVQIERENEALFKAEQVAALVGDHHAKHIEGHLRDLQDPAARADVNVLQAVMTHVQQHVRLWNDASTTPEGMAVLAATGQGPSPAAQMMMQQPSAPPPGAPPEPGAPQTPAPTQPTPDGGGGTPAGVQGPQVPPEAAPIQ